MTTPETSNNFHYGTEAGAPMTADVPQVLYLVMDADGHITSAHLNAAAAELAAFCRQKQSATVVLSVLYPDPKSPAKYPKPTEEEGR